MTPALYLRLRREAAELSLDDVAAAIRTEPAIAAHDRRAWLERIEHGIELISFNTVVALRACFDFDLEVLSQLAEVDLGIHQHPPQVCRVCGCTEEEPCIDRRGSACAWAAIDLCDACPALSQTGEAA